MKETVTFALEIGFVVFLIICVFLIVGAWVADMFALGREEDQ